MSADDIAKAKAEADIVVVSDMDDIRGFAVTSQFFDAWGMKAAQGSLFSDADSQAGTHSLILGSEAAKQIAGDGKNPADLIGKKILAREGYETVVGILSPTGQANYDASIFAPYKPATTAGGEMRRSMFNTQLRFTVSDPAKLSQTEELLSGWFDSRFGQNQIVISNPRGEAQRIIARNQGIGLLILLLSASGLFIALVNVSHILMSRGLRMRKSVGIMMALGASRSAVLSLFAAEACAISAIGAVIGALFAFPLSASMQSALGLAGGSWLYVALGVLISWALTLVFSVAPAWQNSRIVPAEAMRAA
jgi:macrolide transport system ATP-binding/permease protein